VPELQEEGNHLTNAAIATTTEQRFRYLRILQNALYPPVIRRSRGIRCAHSRGIAGAFFDRMDDLRQSAHFRDGLRKRRAVPRRMLM